MNPAQKLSKQSNLNDSQLDGTGEFINILTLARNNIKRPRHITVSFLITSAEKASDASKELYKPRLGAFHKLCLHFLEFFDHVRP